MPRAPRALTLITGLLLVVGGLNWGLVGLFELDLVAEIFGEEFGTTNTASRVVYVLVGIAAIVYVPAVLAALGGRDLDHDHDRASARPMTGD